MKHLPKIIMCALLIAWATQQAGGNVAAPGFYGIGGGVGFVPFFEKDLTQQMQIQMQSEVVKVLLYRNFAIVKGEYLMYNLSDSPIKLKIGYPINSVTNHDNVQGIDFDDLRQFKVAINKAEVKATKLNQQAVQAEVVNKPKHLLALHNWFVWDATFAPKQTTKLQVYFMVNTQGTLRKGYNTDENAGFAYILETGREWAKSIEKGRIWIQLMDNVLIQDILGITPRRFVTNQKDALVYDFQALEPTAKDNILIRLKDLGKSKELAEVESLIDSYYQQIDRLVMPNSTENFVPLQVADFEVHSWQGGMLVSGVFLFFFVVLPMLLVLGFALLLWFWFRKKRKA